VRFGVGYSSGAQLVAGRVVVVEIWSVAYQTYVVGDLVVELSLVYTCTLFPPPPLGFLTAILFQSSQCDVDFDLGLACYPPLLPVLACPAWLLYHFWLGWNRSSQATLPAVISPQVYYVGCLYFEHLVF